MDDLNEDERIHNRGAHKKLSHQLTPSSKSVLPETSEKIRTSAWIIHHHFIYFYLGIDITNIRV
jgi:hypothetical protein